MLTKDTFIRGVKSGLDITKELAQVVIPVYILVTFLKYTPVLPWISEHMVSVMCLVGLPGEASLPLVLGAFINIYAAIGAITPLNLDIRQITIIAAMILLAHSLPVETAVSKKTGVKVFGLVLIRIGGAFILGILLNILL